MIKISKENSENEKSKNCCFVRFYRSPIQIKGDMNNGVTSIILGVNKKSNNLNQENEQVSLTDKQEELKCGLVLRSVGYKTISIDSSLPFDERKGIIKNENGRVIGCGPGLYCSGWVGSGPSGVIVNTMNFSFDVGKNILQDINDGKLNIENKQGISIILEKLKSKNVEVIHFDEWEKIDQFEKELGALQGKTREKVVDINLMIKTAKKVLND